MKSGMSLLVMLSSGFACLGQVEVDDMYFNSKDRAKLSELTQREVVQRELRTNEESKKSLTINPTDSYSSRNINPEYTSRLRTNPNDQQVEESGYFPAGYQPVGVNQTARNSGYYNNAYSNYYGAGAMGNPYAGYGYGNPYSSIYPFWGNPYGYGNSYNMLSMGMGYGWGSSMGYGWSSMPSNMFWNSYYGNSYYNPMAWGGGWNSWGNPYGYSYYSRYTPVVIVTDNGNRPQTVYSKRSDRSSSMNNDVDNSRSTNTYTRTGREISTGRTRSEASNSQNYYDRSWRQNQELSQTRSYWGTESNTRSYSSGNTNNAGRQRTSSWGNDSFHNNSSNTRSWSNDNSSFSGGSRSSSSGSSGSSGGGTRSRGRD